MSSRVLARAFVMPMPSDRIRSTVTESQASSDLRLAPGGHSSRLAMRLGLESPGVGRRMLKILVLFLVTWVPLFLLSLAEGHAFGHRVVVSLLRDPVVYSRFLFVLPLLELARFVVERSLRVQARYFLESGVVPERDRPRFELAKAEVIRLRESFVVEVAMVVLAITISIVARVVVGLGSQGTSWERTGTGITIAGWWYVLVSLPILFFFLLCWLWVFVLWGWFLYRVSRIDLALTATHPDRAGGLGFLGWGIACFSIVLMAVSAVLSGSFAYEILHRGSSLNNLKYHVIVFVILAQVVVHIPLVMFTGRLARCRFRGLLEFGSLIGIRDRQFEEKWIQHRGTDQESLVEVQDVRLVAGLAQAFDHIEQVHLIPLDKRAEVVLFLAAVIPMVPLLGTVVGLNEILSMLGKFLV
jgi:hypothetical protein